MYWQQYNRVWASSIALNSAFPFQISSQNSEWLSLRHHLVPHIGSVHKPLFLIMWVSSVWSPRKHIMGELQVTRQCMWMSSLHCRRCSDFKAPRGMVQLSELLPLELEQHRRWTKAGPCWGPHSQCASSWPTHGPLPQPEGVVQPVVHHGQQWQLFNNCLCGWSTYTYTEADGGRVSGEFSEVQVLSSLVPRPLPDLSKNHFSTAVR